MRVLKWIIDRCRGRVGAEETPLGWMPALQDIDLEGMDYDRTKLEKAFAIDLEEWKKEVLSQDELFTKLHNDLPPELNYQRELLIARL
jgi:phosphoenolpyruvate carboxykinase (GTP)